MYHCSSRHLVKPLLLVSVVDLQRTFQSDCFLFACNELKFQVQGLACTIRDLISVYSHRRVGSTMPNDPLLPLSGPH